MRYVFLLIVTAFFASSNQSASAQSLRIDYAAICASQETQSEFIASLTEEQRQGFYYQAVALGLDTEEYIARSIAQDCQNYRTDSLYQYEFEFDPLISTQSFGQIYCETDWDNECRDEIDFTAPEGYIACDLRYRTDLRGRGKAELENRNFLPSTTGQRSNKFRTIRLDLYAEGSRQFWDRWSSNLKLNDLTFVTIVESATLSERQDRGCRIGEIAVPRPDELQPPSSPSTVSGRVIPGSPHIYEVSVRNESDHPSTMRYEVYVFDSDWGPEGREFLAGRTTLTVPANSTTRNQYVRYGATQWSIRNVHHLPHQ